MNKYTIHAVFLSLISLNAFGWGQKGHDTVAALAEKHLTPTAAAVVDSLLDGRSPVYYANWLDNASHTPEYAYSKTWHYKNIDANETFETAHRNKKGDIVTALDEQITLLADPSKSKEEKALALKMVIHFLGDMHQPMHMGHYSDLGGNKWEVRYFGQEKNLHGVWDTQLVESAHKWSYTEWVDQIDRVPDGYMQRVASGSPADWAKETYEICKDVYKNTPQGYTISYDYIAEMTPIIENQFLKAGYRLADVLNSLFDPTYRTSTSIPALQK